MPRIHFHQPFDQPVRSGMANGPEESEKHFLRVNGIFGALRLNIPKSSMNSKCSEGSPL